MSCLNMTTTTLNWLADDSTVAQFSLREIVSAPVLKRFLTQSRGKPIDAMNTLEQSSARYAAVVIAVSDWTAPPQLVVGVCRTTMLNSNKAKPGGQEMYQASGSGIAGIMMRDEACD